MLSEATSAEHLSPLPPISILLVDDVEANLVALEAVLAPLGHRLVRAASGEQALLCLLQEDFALILMDGQMPGMDGFQTAALIKQRERTRDIPLMFVSAIYKDLGYATRGYAVGAVDYIVKPFEPELMRAKVSAIIAEHNRRERLKAQARALLTQERRVLSEQAARTAAESANRLKDEFIAVVSHELRTPLNAILGWAELLRAGKVAGDTMPKAFDAIHRNAHAQKELVEDLLDISRITSGKLRLERKACDVAALIADEAESARQAARARDVGIELALEPCRAVCDPERLKQIVSNLVGNAVKFSAAGGQIELRLTTAADHFTLEVADRGIGIPAEALPHVFEAFWQAEPSLTRRHGGLGLGLSIVRRLVELHGGIISVTSPGEGLGTTFRVVMPITAVDQPSAPASAAVHEAYPSLDGLRVLFVDDEVDARDLLGALLRELGADVTVAESATVALTAIAHGRFDLVVSDLSMPDADGFTLVERLRSARGQTARLPAIALSAHSDESTRERARRAGFDDFIAKPFSAPTLLAAIVRIATPRG
ncbi:MAG: response regulator receiver sensor hybrid histidine kinase [bacterium]|nr:response regulator receiver sensor hybrid histidine kinase [bacterium]